MLGLLFHCYCRWLFCVNSRFSSMVWPRKTEQPEQRIEMLTSLLNFCPSFLGLPSSQPWWACWTCFEHALNMLWTFRPKVAKGMVSVSCSSPCGIYYCKNDPQNPHRNPKDFRVKFKLLNLVHELLHALTLHFHFLGAWYLSIWNLGLNQESHLLKLKQMTSGLRQESHGNSSSTLQTLTLIKLQLPCKSQDKLQAFEKPSLTHLSWQMFLFPLP